MRRLLARAAGGGGADGRILLMLQGAALAMLQKKSGEEPLSPQQRVIFICVSVGLTLMAGLMSGLTLGLMSMDAVDLEVLRRSGTPREQRYAAGILPLVSHQHFLLVTLLLCNAVAMEALPLFLDRLADPVTAIVISVTAVLVFGEIFPQALCSRYGLEIGYYSSWLVRGLMALTSPVSWTLAKLLDALLGSEHKVMFRRTQLKALVDMHGADEGLGGNLTGDEVKVICGALDLTSKTARRSMTPLPKVFMLSSAARLDRDTMRAVLATGHSRVPVYRDGDRFDMIGLIIVKELLQYKVADAVPVAHVRMRSLPRLSADTPMYDMLKLFQTGRSHMVVLTDSPAAARAAVAEAAAADKESNGAAADDGDAPEEAGLFARLLGGGSASPGPPPAARTDSGPAPFPWWMGEDEYGGCVPVGIITIEDVIEELMQAEIVDETDLFVDNERSVRVNTHTLAQALPARLRHALQLAPQGSGGRGPFAHSSAGAAAAAAAAAAAGGSGSGAAVAAAAPGGPTVTVRKANLRALGGDMAAVGGASGRRASGDGGSGGGGGALRQPLLALGERS
ncbi:MAG: hypothetical protein J3K34DRAFT_518869 [Monoraphidium minutum]|nr:MAG: hypothetical protein J3K34DRAFT_518869 [Monoraphidium minutum]